MNNVIYWNRLKMVNNVMLCSQCAGGGHLICFGIFWTNCWSRIVRARVAVIANLLCEYEYDRIHSFNWHQLKSANINSFEKTLLQLNIIWWVLLMRLILHRVDSYELSVVSMNFVIQSANMCHKNYTLFTKFTISIFIIRFLLNQTSSTIFLMKNDQFTCNPNGLYLLVN